MKVIGQLVCGPNEQYLEETLKEFARICDDVVVATCNATDKEKALIKHYGFWQYEDNREWGKQQPNIKFDLVQKIVRLGADTILALDADETVPTLDRKILETISKERISCMFYVVNLWNDRGHYAKGLGFWNVRAYKASTAAGQPFGKKPVHCGNAPQLCYTLSPKQTYVPHILLHKGLMDSTARQRKVERYNLYDPNARWKGRQYYDALSSIDEGVPYVESELINKIKEECLRAGAI